MVNYYFTQTYEDEYKHLNFEEHKGEFQMQNLTVMINKLHWSMHFSGSYLLQLLPLQTQLIEFFT